MTRLLQCKMEHVSKNQSPCPECTGLKQCRYCPTELQIDFEVFESRWIALVVTKWLPLGTGMSPPDRKWHCHLRRAIFYPPLEPFTFIAGSIQSAFEQQADFEFESLLTPENAQQLLPTNVTNVGLLKDTSRPGTNELEVSLIKPV